MTKCAHCGTNGPHNCPADVCRPTPEDMSISELLRRLTDDYAFECEGGPLRNCVEFIELKRRALATSGAQKSQQRTGVSRE